jgi:hypothetical protein
MNHAPPSQTATPSALSHSERSRGESIFLCLVVFLFLLLPAGFASAQDVNVPALVDAIKSAEGSIKHPYGILKPYCKPNDPDGQCRKGCTQTVNKWLKRISYTSPEDFIRQFGAIYCPIGVSNDPNGLNKNWVRNVTKLYRYYAREKAR